MPETSGKIDVERNRNNIKVVPDMDKGKRYKLMEKDTSQAKKIQAKVEKIQAKVEKIQAKAEKIQVIHQKIQAESKKD